MYHDFREWLILALEGFSEGLGLEDVKDTLRESSMLDDQDCNLDLKDTEQFFAQALE